MKSVSTNKYQEIFTACASILNPESVITRDNIPWEAPPLSLALTPGIIPSCLVYPQTASQLAEIVTLAHKNQWSILPCGHQSKLSWGGLAKSADIILSTARLNQLVDHAVGDLTITVEAGMKFADLQQILAQKQQFLAIDPIYPESATIGGIIATADTGSWRQRYGSVRDQLLGITFIRSDGEVAKAGGRVVKNVAGYDLMKLFTGSYGTLGVLTQVTFRVYPKLPASLTVMLTGTPSAISQTAATLRNSALTPTQADMIMQDGAIALVTRFQSIPESVEEQGNQVLQLGEKLGLQGTIYRDAEEEKLWQGLRESIHGVGDDSPITCKIGILPSAAIEILTQVDLGVVHIASGLGVLRVRGNDAVREISKWRSLCEQNQGFLSILSAPVAVKQKLDVWGYAGNGLQLMQLIKQQFDSQNIFSPGRFVGGI
ncbi:FAD-binding oxidoreductase [Calothrix sp. 336/3]|uniref:FAD-binding oxidoreductase n=1 Tax=Calothrix sp. 336/3 TaxID=1337936 RepID=UPI0004E30EBD|nr:FAD-binding oxidoreductase [Calothrix sp. 336/3]AKG23731.1 glycolate oxidase [Calothrix sp. 336/3]